MRHGGTLSLLLTLIACGPAEEPKGPQLNPEDVFRDEDPNVDIRKAKLHIEKAVGALRDGRLEVARKELATAEPFADELKREEIRRVRQSIDETEANKYIPNINKAATSGKCEEAVEVAADVIGGKKGGAIPAFIKEGTSKKILKCLLDQLSVDLSIARELAEDKKKVKLVLTKETYQELTTKVTDATVKELIGQFDEVLKEREWVKAKALLDELVEKKEAGPNEYNRIMELIRKGVAEDIAEKVQEGLDDKSKATAALKTVDELIVVAEWGEKKGSAAAGTPMPKDVDKGRKALALQSVCSNIKCTFVGPYENWTYGNVELRPMLDPKQDSLGKIKHATRVWRIAESSSWILVSKKEPPSFAGVEDRLPWASGWVASGGLKSADTAEMLPPGDSIVGTRIWGPLRETEPTWELGHVRDVKGGDLGVERLADGSIISIARSKVRFGTVAKGTKVLSRCTDPLKPTEAIIEKVTFPKGSDAVATVNCLDKSGNPSGTTREELLGSLRSKPAWLPAAK